MDDLSQLDFSASAGGSTTTTNNAQRKGYGKTNFDFISQMQPSTSANSSRTPSPFAVRRPPPPQATTLLPKPSPFLSSSSQTRLNPSAAASNGKGSDAFSDLFSASPSSTSSGGRTGLSMAERLEKENAAARAVGGGHHLNVHQQQQHGSAGSWRPLSPVSTGGSASSRGVSPALPSRSNSRNVVPQVFSTHTAPPAPSTWDFDLLASSTSHQKPPPPPSSHLDPFSLDFDDAPLPPSAVPPSTSAAGTSEFDLLGVLSAPLPSRASPSPLPSRSQTPLHYSSPVPRPNSVSPPPHVLGQIVEMGFSVQQAQVALVATKTDEGEWDVAAALEAIVLEEETESLRKKELDLNDDEEEAGLTGRRERSRRRSWEEEEEGGDSRGSVVPVRVKAAAAPTAPAPVGRRAREAAAAAATANSNANASTSRAGNEASAKVQEQAAELLAQASKLGFSVFKSANAYWETGRATIAKKLEETRAAGGENGGEFENVQRRNGNGREATGSGRGRPKWMAADVQIDEGENGTLPRKETSTSRSDSSRAQGKHRQREEVPPPPLFQDDDDDDDDDDEDSEDVPESVLPQRPVASNRKQPEPSRSRPPEPVLVSSEPPKDYRSPWRRRNPVDVEPPSAAALATAAPTPKSTPSRPAPPVAPKPVRQPRPVVSATPSQLSESATHKAKGNELFKLGRFGDAEQSYGLAISSLPPGHVTLLPLFNNRATARLKVGDEKGAIDDSTKVVDLVLGPLGIVGGRVDTATLDEESARGGGDIDLREQLGKALGKRAKASEVLEKWKNAQLDWSVLMAGGEGLSVPAGGTKLVSEGLTRCRKMLGEVPAATSTTTKSSALQPKPTPSSSSAPRRPPQPMPSAQPSIGPNGDAVRALRTANAAADAEDDLRLSLKDGVDDRINAWKAGKETNLRALIASLDSVLWPGVGWKKVGLHELISDGQVKVCYVRAIAKVHPDKLAVGDTRVEDRMVAGLVFSALNDAWLAHQQRKS